MDLLKSNNPLLRIVSKEFDFESADISAQEIYDLLRNKMYELKTLGLSAPQLGIMYRVFVFGNPDEPDSIMPVFNPKIVNFGDDSVVYEEQCSTFPGLFLKIRRPTTIRMRYTNLNGDIETHNFQGMTARVAQHEVNHLDGVLFTDKANLYHLQQAKRRKLKMDRVRRANDRQVAV